MDYKDQRNRVDMRIPTLLDSIKTKQHHSKHIGTQLIPVVMSNKIQLSRDQRNRIVMKIPTLLDSIKSREYHNKHTSAYLIPILMLNYK